MPGGREPEKFTSFLGREALKQAFPGLHFLGAVCYNGT